MDGLVFIAALGVGIAVSAWYALNEARGADGGVGIFALRGEAGPAPEQTDAAAAVRYRARPRLAPGRRADPQNQTVVRRYRLKSAERPFRDDTVQADTEY